MENNSYKVLVRIIKADELDAIESGDEDNIGSNIVDTVKNTFDRYNEDQNYGFCYTIDLEAQNITEAKTQIKSYDYSLLTEEELGQCLKYMLKEKQEFEPDNYQIFCMIMPEEEYEKMKAYKKIIEGDGFYETDDGESYEIPEVIATPDVFINAYNRGHTMYIDPKDIALLPTNDGDEDYRY